MVEGTNEGLQISGSFSAFLFRHFVASAFIGEEELSLLLGGLNSVSSSRPTTSGAGDVRSVPVSDSFLIFLSFIPSRPPSQHPHLAKYSHLSTDCEDPHRTGTNRIRRSTSSSLIQSAGRAAVGESRSLSTLQKAQEAPPPEPIDYSAYGF